MAPTARLAASGHAGKTVHCTVFFFRLSLRFRPFTGSILINSQAIYIAKTTKKQMTFIICSHSGSHSWTRTNDILINSQALYRLSYAGIFNFVLNHLCRLSFCRATLLPTPFPSPSFGSLRGNPSGAVPTQAMREYLILF